MKKILAILCLLPLCTSAQQDSVLSGVYNWNEPDAITGNKISSVVLLEGKTHDFKWMQLTANSLNPSPVRIKQTVPKNQEQLIIVKTGILQIGLGDSSFALNAGSVVVLIPGEKILLNSSQPCSFYVMKYQSKSPKNIERAKQNGGSFLKFWEAIPFKPNNNGGGRRDFFEQPTAMQKRFEMHVTTLKEGLRSHDPHTHRAEEIILMIEGDTEMQIGEKFAKGKTGDFFYLGSNVLHGIRNVGSKPCMYFAIQFE
ncbi:MAG: cupin domain-containing protein [Lacibacter sp.]